MFQFCKMQLIPIYLDTWKAIVMPGCPVRPDLIMGSYQ